MRRSTRLLAACLATLLLLSAGGCHYDYGYYSVGYSYGYDCYPRYHSSWGCDYGYYGRGYHAPCDGIRFRTRHVFDNGYRYHRPCR